MRRTTTALAALWLTGCAAMPDYIRPEETHDSHVLQHEPFTSEPTKYGRDMLGVALVWRRGHWTGEVSEGYDFHGTEGLNTPAGREVFHGMIGYEIPLKHR